MSSLPLPNMLLPKPLQLNRRRIIIKKNRISSPLPNNEPIIAPPLFYDIIYYEITEDLLPKNYKLRFEGSKRFKDKCYNQYTDSVQDMERRQKNKA
jgi:hypothetical protein